MHGWSGQLNLLVRFYDIYSGRAKYIGEIDRICTILQPSRRVGQHIIHVIDNHHIGRRERGRVPPKVGKRGPGEMIIIGGGGGGGGRGGGMPRMIPRHVHSETVFVFELLTAERAGGL